MVLICFQEFKSEATAKFIFNDQQKNVQRKLYDFHYIRCTLCLQAGKKMAHKTCLKYIFSLFIVSIFAAND